MRDRSKLKVFELADQLALLIYQSTLGFPKTEQYGLQSQVRRAAVSIAANIVEGCARTSQSEYARFIEIAYGSARELQYEIGLCERLGYFEASRARELHEKCTNTAKALSSLVRTLQSE
jgi:four helix bundle protein